jgi:hypothetical protein
MKANILRSTGLASLLLIAGIASAQSSGVVDPVDVLGTGTAEVGGYGYHSSTYEEGRFRGLGDFTRSIGEADYMSSLAGINRQEAVSRAIDNRKKAVETFFEIKQINRAAREAARPQPLTTSQYEKLAKQLAPDRLGEVDYNRVVGRLSWPAAFSSEEFAAERTELDKAFAGRTARDVGVSTAFNGKVRKLADAMEDKLHDKLHSMSPMEFMAAQKFLTSLKYEAHQPLVVAGLATIR